MTDHAAFRSIYRHGFARVAACTLPVQLADPASNAEATASLAARCGAEGAVLAVFPELGISGYTIDDLRQQDALLDAVDDAIGLLRARSLELLPLLLVGAPLRHAGALFQLRGGDPSRTHPRRGAEIVTCRTTANSTRRVTSPPASAAPAGARRSRATGCRSAPTCCSRRATSPA